MVGELMVKFCDKCGAELKEGVKFCDKCGAEVKFNENNGNVATTVSGFICPHCGQPTTFGLNHCEKCGSSFEDNTAAVIIGYIVTFFLPVIGLIPAFYLLSRNNGKAKTQGVFLIGIIIISLIIFFIFRSWAYFVIMIILMIVGIFLWFNDFNICN